MPPKPENTATPGKRRERWLISLLGLVGQLLIGTLRFREIHPERFLQFRRRGQPVIFAVWHAQLLLVVRHAELYQITTLASPSRDGEIGVRIGERLGVTSIRGDERYAPLAALRKLARALKRGGSLGLFPDGPLGPAHRIKPGLLMLARRSGCPIIPVGVDAAWKVSFYSGWDHFIVPLPFSRVFIKYGEPFFIPENATPAERESVAATIAERMDALSRRTQ